jgi:hypothetical protein
MTTGRINQIAIGNLSEPISLSLLGYKERYLSALTKVKGFVIHWVD